METEGQMQTSLNLHLHGKWHCLITNIKFPRIDFIFIFLFTFLHLKAAEVLTYITRYMCISILFSLQKLFLHVNCPK